MDACLKIAGALSDRSRVRALMALRRGELCVCQITALLQLAPSTVSKHMGLLRDAGLVVSRKEGRWIHYSRVSGDTNPVAAGSLAWLDQSVERDQAVLSDERDLDRILRTPAEELCKL